MEKPTKLISSILLTEQINFFREDKGLNVKMHHKSLLAKIRKDFPSFEGVFESSRKDKQNRVRSCIMVTEEVAKKILDKENYTVRTSGRHREQAVLACIEQLKGVKLIPQFSVLEYYIDGYDPINKIAYEIDEPQHKDFVKENLDRMREKKIQQVLGCSFVRINI